VSLQLADCVEKLKSRKS
jgi:hypothetical protein